MASQSVVLAIYEEALKNRIGVEKDALVNMTNDRAAGRVQGMQNALGMLAEAIKQANDSPRGDGRT